MRLAGILLVFAAMPILTIWLQGNVQRFRYAAFAMGFLPFVIELANLDAALISWRLWPGHTKGLIVTLLDSLAIAVLIANRRKIGFPTFIGLLILYFFAAALSVAFSDVMTSSAFYAFQVARAILVFLAVVALMKHEGSQMWLCYGFASAMLTQAAFSMYQKLGGVAQASGTLSHQNLLGMMLHFSVISLIAIILAGNRKPMIMAGAMAGLLAAALTASRATIGFLAAGIAVLIVLSLMRRVTVVKWRALGLGLVAAMLLAPLALSNLGNRTQESIESSDREREAFETAALNIWTDHPMGVGANRYVVTANVEGYSSDAGVVPVSGSRSAHVHNIYLLHAAEMGWLGLITFVVLVVTAIIRGIVHSIKARDDPGGDLVLGASVAMLVMAAHGYFEWIIITTSPQYLLVTALGVIAGCRHVVASNAAPVIVAGRDRIVEQVMR